MSRRVFWGTALLAIGVALIASNLGYLRPFSLWDLWPILIIWPAARLVIGGLHFVIVDGRRMRKMNWGPDYGLRLIVLWVLVGAVAQLLENLHLTTWGWGEVAIWTFPVMLVLLGVVVLSRPRRGRWTCFSRHDWTEGDIEDEEARVSSLVGDIRWGSRPWDFKNPTRVRLFAGDFDMDLTTARFQPGDNHLEVRAWAGQVDILAPEGIAVDVNARCSAGQIRVFGQSREGVGAEVSARRAAAGGSSATNEANGGDATRPPRLFIDIDMTFGEVRVR